jgi:gas vesicle protein
MNRKSMGLLSAVAAGVVIGLLVAPEKGSEMRRRLKKTAGNLKEKFNDMADKTRRGAKDAMDTAREAVNNFEDTRTGDFDDRRNMDRESFV